MTDVVDKLQFALNPTGVVVRVGTRGEAATFDELLALKPNAAAPDLAKTINQLVHGRDFEVITDPAAFKAAYEERLASEGAATAWAEGVFRLSDYGVPDFAVIAAPTISGGKLTYFASEATTGLPFRADGALSAGSPPPDYTPLALTPIPGTPAPVPPVPQGDPVPEQRPLEE